MATTIQAIPDYFLWAGAGKPAVVHLHLSVIDRLSAEVMRGFGLVPKRGAEVGGVLLGTIEEGPVTIVKIEDFEAVPCEYRHGPSYLLSADDGAAFDDACAHSRPDPSRATYAVGYFRSHTREGLSPSPEDLVLMDHYFPSSSQVALLIKPFATKVSVASFFFRENGIFPSTPPLEFPFRRRELTGEEAPPRRSMLERVPGRRAVAPEHIEEPVAATEPVPVYTSPKPRTSWVWLPLSFVFLLLGVVLGFQAALTMGPRTAANGGVDYALGLTVTREGNSLSVRWDRDAAAVKGAQKGILEIEDGGVNKPYDLDPAQLRNGTILFTNTSKTVRFRLTVYPQPGLTVIQTLEWK